MELQICNTPVDDAVTCMLTAAAVDTLKEQVWIRATVCIFLMVD